jgi:hypothetical protein
LVRNPLRLVFNARSVNGWRVLSFPQPAMTTAIEETATTPLLLALQA